MNDNGKQRDRADDDRDAVDKELEGVPEEMIDREEAPEEDEHKLEDALGSLRDDLERAQQDILYARAETQNVRRRMEKDLADARAYAATAFARDVLSVADNLARAVDTIPEDLREDSKFKGLVQGIQATQRELEKVFAQHGITRIAAMGLPLDPNQHQAMMEVPDADAEPGKVVQEMQVGYMIKDRLLRPAMVAVARKPDGE